MYSFGDTGISVNQNHSNALLVMVSAHGDGGDATYTKLSLLRTGLSGDHLHESIIAENRYVNTYGVNISLSNSKIYISGWNVVQPAILIIATNHL